MIKELINKFFCLHKWEVKKSIIMEDTSFVAHGGLPFYSGTIKQCCCLKSRFNEESKEVQEALDRFRSNIIHEFKIVSYDYGLTGEAKIKIIKGLEETVDYCMANLVDALEKQNGKN